MFGIQGIKLDKAIVARAREQARTRGYASVEEYLTHLVERDLTAAMASDDEKQAIVDKMKGLGYLE